MTVVADGHVSNDGEAKPAASGVSASGAIDPVKPFEDPLAFTQWDTNPTIFDDKVGEPALRALHGKRFDDDRFAFVRIFDRIFKKIVDRSDDQRSVGVDHEMLFQAFDPKFDTDHLCARAQLRTANPDQFAEVDFASVGWPRCFE